MTRLYSDDDLWEAYAQRRRILAVFFAVTAVWALALVALFVYYALLPYADPNQGWVPIVAFVLTGIYILFSFPYLSICFKRCSAYCKMLRFISRGLKEYAVMPFTGIDDWITRDGVDVNVVLFRVRSVKRDEEMTRQIYVDGEKDFPPFEEEGMVRVVSQGNLLIEYQLMGKSQQPKE